MLIARVVVETDLAAEQTHGRKMHDCDIPSNPRLERD
jgi:hypothetical protein